MVGYPSNTPKMRIHTNMCVIRLMEYVPTSVSNMCYRRTRNTREIIHHRMLWQLTLSSCEDTQTNSSFKSTGGKCLGPHYNVR